MQYKDNEMTQDELAKYATYKIGEEVILQRDLHDKYPKIKFPKGSILIITKYVALCTSNGVLDDVGYECVGKEIKKEGFVSDWEIAHPESTK